MTFYIALVLIVENVPAHSASMYRRTAVPWKGFFEPTSILEVLRDKMYQINIMYYCFTGHSTLINAVFILRSSSIS